MRVRALNTRQHQARVRELKRLGCKVSTVERPEGTIVLRRCPPGVQPSSLGEMPERFPWLAAASVAVAGALAVFAITRTAAP